MFAILNLLMITKGAFIVKWVHWVSYQNAASFWDRFNKEKSYDLRYTNGQRFFRLNSFYEKRNAPFVNMCLHMQLSNNNVIHDKIITFKTYLVEY